MEAFVGDQDFFDFAYRTFRWDSESLGMAHVHCVIIGFKAIPSGLKNWIFDGSKKAMQKTSTDTSLTEQIPLLKQETLLFALFRR